MNSIDYLYITNQKILSYPVTWEVAEFVDGTGLIAAAAPPTADRGIAILATAAAPKSKTIVTLFRF